MNRKIPIYVIGYPKSGTTWLTRMLGDLFECPTGASIAAADDSEIATEGADRVSDYVVRKGHFVFTEDESKAGRELSR